MLPEAVREVLAEARSQVASGRAVDVDALAVRIRAAGLDGREERQALKQLERVVAVHRARARLTREPPKAPPPAPAARRALIRTRPSITANMEVRRGPGGDGHRLEWDGAPAVTEWEIRFSERPDPRSEYEVRETLTLGTGTTGVELPLSERPLRVHVLGRRRDGKLLRRAVITGLTVENWDDRWQRRPSAA